MAKSKNPRTPTRSGARGKGKDSGFEVEDQGQAAGAPGADPAAPSVEQLIVMVTFVALFVALLLSQIELGSSYGRGLFG